MTEGLQGWQPDPYQRHELRYFSAGNVTYLVRDGQVEGRDPVEQFASANVANGTNSATAVVMGGAMMALATTGATTVSAPPAPLGSPPVACVPLPPWASPPPPDWVYSAQEDLPWASPVPTPPVENPPAPMTSATPAPAAPSTQSYVVPLPGAVTLPPQLPTTMSAPTAVYVLSYGPPTGDANPFVTPWQLRPAAAPALDRDETVRMAGPTSGITEPPASTNRPSLDLPPLIAPTPMTSSAAERPERRGPSRRTKVALAGLLSVLVGVVVIFIVTSIGGSTPKNSASGGTASAVADTAFQSSAGHFKALLPGTPRETSSTTTIGTLTATTNTAVCPNSRTEVVTDTFSAAIVTGKEQETMQAAISAYAAGNSLKVATTAPTTLLAKPASTSSLLTAGGQRITAIALVYSPTRLYLLLGDEGVGINKLIAGFAPVA